MDKYCWSVSPRWDTGVLSHRVCQVLIKSDAKQRTNSSDVTNHIHHIWRTWWPMITHSFKKLDFMHLSAIKVFFLSSFLSGKVSSLLEAVETSCFPACFDQTALHEYQTWPCGGRGLERGRAMTRARSLLPKTKTSQPLSLHMPPAEREIILHHCSWNRSTASKCAFRWSKDSESNLGWKRRWKSCLIYFRWKNFPNLVCNKTKGSETDCYSTNKLLKNREVLIQALKRRALSL